MDDERNQNIEKLKCASPLEVTKILYEMELYDKKSSQEIIDEVYEQFASGENMTEEIVKPVFLSVIDGLLEASPQMRKAKKHGLTASRVLTECEQFSYDGLQNHGTNVDGYTEWKNAKYYDTEYNIAKNSDNHGDNLVYGGNVNSQMTQNPSSREKRKLYEDKQRMDGYKDRKTIGHSTVQDEYTGKTNLYDSKKNRPNNATDEKYANLAETDHIVPLKQMHESLKHNYALDDNDIKNIANCDYNFAMTAAAINDGRGKGAKTNQEFIKEQEKKGTPVDKITKENMLRLQKEAEKAINDQVNRTVIFNALGKSDTQTINQKYDVMMESKIRAYEKKHGVAPDEKKLASMKALVDKKREEEIASTKETQKQKGKEIRSNAASEAATQATQYFAGNLLLYIVKPLYYEMSDIIKNGMIEGVDAENATDAIKIRFGRMKDHVVTHFADFMGENAIDFIKGFVSSLIEGVISLFVGIFKQILKVVKEGIKIFVQSAKILFGKEAEHMSPAEKGDAIIKILGGSVVAIAGVAIESLLNKIGIGEPWSIILSTMLSGIASTLFMYILNKMDLFSLNAEKRKERIVDIFNERISDINDAAEKFNYVAIDTLKRQREEFETICSMIKEKMVANNIIGINDGLYKMAELMNVELEYSNTEEFCDYMDSTGVLEI